MKKQGKKAYDREERETSVESLKDGEIPIENKDREALGEGHKYRESSVESQNKEAILNQLKWNSILTPIGQEILKKNLQISAQEEKAALKTSANGNVNYTT